MTKTSTRQFRHFIGLATVATLVGCASTQVTTTGTQLSGPLCKVPDNKLATTVYWTPIWRPDQKEPPLREAAALRGMQSFFQSTGCLSPITIERLPAPANDQAPSDEVLLQRARTAQPDTDRVVLVVVRELGPKLWIGLPMIVEGGTEAVLEVRVLDAKNKTPLADVHTHWQNGGKFVIKGVKTLDHDMAEALRAVLPLHD